MKIKLKSLPAIKRRIFKLVSLICRERAGYKCEVCGMKKGDLHNSKPQRVEAHHIFSRSIKDSPMKFDIKNLICLCTLCHKTGNKSAHKNPVWFGEWLRINKPEQYTYVLEHFEDTVDLDDRNILDIIEKNLIEYRKTINQPVVNT